MSEMIKVLKLVDFTEHLPRTLQKSNMLCVVHMYFRLSNDNAKTTLHEKCSENRDPSPGVENKKERPH